ncbi:MAG: glycosyltransferase family 39 protein [Candidatus Diapherotrites archaeon]|nr:glycosyltransferase family 39 protein [Candidatus Diapherotrites archaeon]
MKVIFLTEHEHHEKTGKSSDDFVGRIQKKIIDNKKMILLLLVIFILAFSIRAHLMRYEYIFEFDSYYHLRLVGELIQHGQIPANDPLAYYQLGGAKPPGFSLLWPISSAFYLIIGFGKPFSKDLLLLCAKMLPALFGALISLAMYWLGKEVYNKKAGVAMAFIAATVPAFVYRTMAGFFEEDSLGFLWMVIGFVFMLRATKSEKITKQSIINSVLAGIFFSMMALTWTLYLLVPLIITPYFIFSLLILATRESKEKLTAFIANFGIGYVIFNIAILLIGGNWIQNGVSYIARFMPDFIDPLILPAIILIVIGTILLAYLIEKMKEDNRQIMGTVFVVLLWIILLGTAMIFIFVGDILDRTAISSMVGEESTGKQFFGQKYNSLIIFPALALLLIPAGIIFSRNRERLGYGTLIIFFWVLITLIMAYYKLKFTYSFGLPVAAAAGFVVYFVFEIIERAGAEKKVESKIIVVALLFTLLLSVGAAAIFVPEYRPTLDEDPKWKEAINWISGNTPQDTKLFNWWNQGHIISFITGRKVSSDNRNYSEEANRAMAEFIVTEDVNEAYQIVAKEIGADYVVLESSMMLQEAQFYFYSIGKVDTSDPALQKYSAAPANTFSCVSSGDSISCQGNTFSAQDFNKFPEKWNMVPTTFYNGKEPIYLYKENLTLIALNRAVNNSNIAKVWFNSDDTRDKYEEVFSNGSIKIFKIIK